MKHLILFENFKINEGHSGEYGEAPSQNMEEAKKELQKWIDNSQDEPGDLSKFTGVKYVGTTTEEKMDKLSMKYEDEYIILGMVDNVLSYCYSRRD